MTDNIKRRTALITGAGQGIGAAIAYHFAEFGFNVAINDITEAAEVAQECRRCYGSQGSIEAECYPADVSNYSECERMVKSIKDKFGTIDVLVNNAGITRDGLLARMSEEQYDSVIAVNQKSVFNLTKLVGAVMLRQKSGSIINLSSVAGVHGNAGQFNYSASKAAVIGMTKSAAKEFASRGITVNAIAPGFIETSMTGKLTDEQQSAILGRIGMKRFGHPNDVAELAVFLANADYITGQTIEISGGMLI
jgi:3-oxoacyl-[acyl-carrier protein] reductase